MTDDERYDRLKALANGEVPGLSKEDQGHLAWMLGLHSQFKTALRRVERALDDTTDHWCGICETYLTEMHDMHALIRQLLGMAIKPPHAENNEDLLS
jgi:hypothetical protein